MGDLSTPNGSPLVVVGFDPGLRITAWNRRAELVFGTDATSAIGRSLADVLPLAGDASWQTAIDAAGDPAPRVWSIRRPDATWSLEAWSQLEHDGDGRVTAVTIIGHDATVRQAELAMLTLKATLLKAIEDNLEVALWAIDEDALFLYQDGKAIRSAGLAPHQFVGQNILQLYKESTSTEAILRGLKGEAHRIIGDEQHGLIWDTWFIPLADHPTARLAGLTLNVTDIRRTENDLRTKLELIERQQEVIRELATPIIEVWDGVLTMPIVGLVDTARTAEIMDSLLQSVTRTRARYAILDLTGVEVVDTGTASHLLNMIAAIRLLGAEGILTGIHPTIAQTMVALGIDLSRVAVFSKLREALKYCLVNDRKRVTKQ